MVKESSSYLVYSLNSGKVSVSATGFRFADLLVFSIYVQLSAK